MITEIKTVSVFKDDELSQLKEALEDSYDAARNVLVKWGTNAELEAYYKFTRIIKNAIKIKIINEKTEEE